MSVCSKCLPIIITPTQSHTEVQEDHSDLVDSSFTFQVAAVKFQPSFFQINATWYLVDWNSFLVHTALKFSKTYCKCIWVYLYYQLKKKSNTEFSGYRITISIVLWVLLVLPSMIGLNSFYLLTVNTFFTKLFFVVVAADSLSYCSYWFLFPSDFSTHPDFCILFQSSK